MNWRWWTTRRERIELGAQVLDALESRNARIEDLEKALAFYAAERNWEWHDSGDPKCAAEDDAGRIARAALAEGEGEK